MFDRRGLTQSRKDAKIGITKVLQPSCSGGCVNEQRMESPGVYRVL